jgi:DNA-binding SARP family transcriptional activator
MRFNVLGSLEIVCDDDELLELSSRNQRATLGSLLLHPNRVVSTCSLITKLWGEDAPPTARKMLQNAVAGLREVLPQEGDTALLTKAPGYVLNVNPDDVDLVRFRRLAATGRAKLHADKPEAALDLLHEALQMWRGSALEDLAEFGIDWPELEFLQQERRTTFEDWIDASLATCRHHEVIDELEAAHRQDPCRERLCGLLLLALYRCGRQADALEAFRRTSIALSAQFGTEVDPGLRGLEQAIRQQHPALLLPSNNKGCFVRTARCG